MNTASRFFIDGSEDQKSFLSSELYYKKVIQKFLMYRSRL
jgi:hypothetical protein